MMATPTYQARISFEAYEDSYTEGEIGNCSNSWDETLTADTPAELLAKVLEVTYSKAEFMDGDQINEYDHATEYHTSYMADADNQGDASNAQIEEWRQGRLRLWAINCHILVTQLTSAKAELPL